MNALPCNEPYNVYTAYIYNTDDHKLTKMPGVIGSDYINASFIDVWDIIGYKAKHMYIATQSLL